MQYNYNVKPIDFTAYFKGKQMYDQNQMAKQKQAQEDEIFQLKKQQLKREMSLVDPQKLTQGILMAHALASSNSPMTGNFIRSLGSQFEPLKADAEAIATSWDSGDPEKRNMVISRLGGIAKSMDSKFGGDKTAQIQTFEYLTDIALNSTDPKMRKWAEMQLGSLSKEGTKSAPERLAGSQDLTEDVAESQATIVGAKARAEGDEEIKTQDIKDRNKDELEQEKTERARSESWDLYQAGLASVMKAQGASWNGSIVGLLPAISDGQRITEGATDILFNAIVPMFKVGGGTFTDDDAARIYNMLPTRKDDIDVAKFKLEAVDMLVRAKVGIPWGGGQEGDSKEMTPEMKRELEELRAARERGEF